MYETNAEQKIRVLSRTNERLYAENQDLKEAKKLLLVACGTSLFLLIFAIIRIFQLVY